MRKLYLAGLLFVVLAAALILGGPEGRATPHPGAVTQAVFGGQAGSWFQGIRPYCNPVEVETRHRWNPAPEGMQGKAYSAACYALAGKIDTARDLILSLDGDDRWRAAGIVFDVAHPVADAGDDRSAGPIMELVVEFWPNHYMALYHAGMSRHALGDPDAAERYLREFLQSYDQDDGWVRSAEAVLDRIDAR